MCGRIWRTGWRGESIHGCGSGKVGVLRSEEGIGLAICELVSVLIQVV